MKRSRIRVISDARIQLRLAGVFILWSGVLVICAVGIYFMSYSKMASRIQSMELNEQLLAKSLLMQQAEDLAVSFGSLMILFFIVIGLYIMVYSHRLVGPIFKLNQTIRESIRMNEWPKPLKFRKNDEFKELASNFNAFVEWSKGRK